MTVILTPTGEHKVEARDGLWMGAADAARVTGWTLKPEGMCRDERCVPLPASAVAGGDVDVETFWKKLGGPAIPAEGGAVWSLGTPADEHKARLDGLEAPDFMLPDVDGTLRTLSQLRGKKVFLATWASW